VQEVLKHRKNGLLFDVFDVEGLAREVVDVLGNSNEFAALGKAARQTVVERYDLQRRCLPDQIRLILN
jgi:glycosyltransferase involved in cell wall biosynthesis